jgi:hypothetical protein
MKVSKFAEGFGFIESGTKLLDDNDSNKQRAETVRQGVTFISRLMHSLIQNVDVKNLCRIRV